MEKSEFNAENITQDQLDKIDKMLSQKTSEKHNLVEAWYIPSYIPREISKD
jgi:hypothetical protein